MSSSATGPLATSRARWVRQSACIASSTLQPWSGRAMLIDLPRRAGLLTWQRPRRPRSSRPVPRARRERPRRRRPAPPPPPVTGATAQGQPSRWHRIPSCAEPPVSSAATEPQALRRGHAVVGEAREPLQRGALRVLDHRAAPFPLGGRLSRVVLAPRPSKCAQGDAPVPRGEEHRSRVAARAPRSPAVVLFEPRQRRFLHDQEQPVRTGPRPFELAPASPGISSRRARSGGRSPWIVLRRYIKSALNWPFAVEVAHVGSLVAETIRAVGPPQEAVLPIEQDASCPRTRAGSWPVAPACMLPISSKNSVSLRAPAPASRASPFASMERAAHVPKEPALERPLRNRPGVHRHERAAAGRSFRGSSGPRSLLPVPCFPTSHEHRHVRENATCSMTSRIFLHRPQDAGRRRGRLGGTGGAFAGRRVETAEQRHEAERCPRAWARSRPRRAASPARLRRCSPTRS